MNMVKTSKGSWKITGVNFIPSDSVCSIIKDAVEKNNLEQSFLQRATGHLAPIIINHEDKTIDFCRS